VRSSTSNGASNLTAAATNSFMDFRCQTPPVSSAVQTRDGVVFGLPVPGHASLKVFWTTAGSRIEAILPHPRGRRSATGILSAHLMPHCCSRGHYRVHPLGGDAPPRSSPIRSSPIRSSSTRP